MARLFIPICAVVISLFCTEMANVDSSNDDLQEQEKPLGTLRKHIEECEKDYKQAIPKVGETLVAETQESSINYDEEVKEKADESDDNNLSHFAEYAGTNFERLCSGEILLTDDIQKTLKCRYVDHAIPFLKIAPFKEEEASMNPRIVLYHDVIYEEEIETLKRFSKPLLERAKIINTTTGEKINSNYRIAKSAWITEYENKHVMLLNRRVAHFTGLSINRAEDLQIAFYEIGGLYLPHLDFMGDRQDPQDGDRIATALFYMNDVAKGGATAFPYLNIALWPKKGSAAFWYNLKRNGEGHPLTEHGACPVLSGTKWIATKWLHENGQELRRPCTLLENE